MSLSSKQKNPKKFKYCIVRFLNTHKIEVNIPKLIEQTGRNWSGQARGKGGGSDGKDKGGGNGALLAALAIKGSFLAMAYQGD